MSANKQPPNINHSDSGSICVSLTGFPHDTTDEEVVVFCRRFGVGVVSCNMRSPHRSSVRFASSRSDEYDDGNDNSSDSDDDEGKELSVNAVVDVKSRGDADTLVRYSIKEKLVFHGRCVKARMI